MNRTFILRIAVALTFSFIILGCVTAPMEVVKRWVNGEYDTSLKELNQYSNHQDFSALHNLITATKEFDAAKTKYLNSKNELEDIADIEREISVFAGRLDELDALSEETKNSMYTYKFEPLENVKQEISILLKRMISGYFDYASFYVDSSTDVVINMVERIESTRRGGFIPHPAISAFVAIQNSGELSDESKRLINSLLSYYFSDLESFVIDHKTALSRFFSSSADKNDQRELFDEAVELLTNAEVRLREQRERIEKFAKEIIGVSILAENYLASCDSIDVALTLMKTSNDRMFCVVALDEFKRDYGSYQEFKNSIDFETRRLEKEKKRDQVAGLIDVQLRRIEKLLSILDRRPDFLNEELMEEKVYVESIRNILVLDRSKNSTLRSIVSLSDMKREIEAIFQEKFSEAVIRYKINGNTTEVRIRGIETPRQRAAVTFIKYFLFLISPGKVPDLDEIPKWAQSENSILYSIIELVKTARKQIVDPNHFLSEIEVIAKKAFPPPFGEAAIKSFFEVAEAEVPVPIALITAFDILRSVKFNNVILLYNNNKLEGSALLNPLFPIDDYYARLYSAYARFGSGVSGEERSSLFDSISQGNPTSVSELQWALLHVKTDFTDAVLLNDICAFGPIPIMAVESARSALKRFADIRDTETLIRAAGILSRMKTEWAYYNKLSADLRNIPLIARFQDIAIDIAEPLNEADELLALCFLELGEYDKAEAVLKSAKEIALGNTKIRTVNFNFLERAIAEARALEIIISGGYAELLSDHGNAIKSELTITRLSDLRYVEAKLGWLRSSIAMVMFGNAPGKIQDLSDDVLEELNRKRYIGIVGLLMYKRGILDVASAKDEAFVLAREWLASGKIDPKTYAFIAAYRLARFKNLPDILRSERENLESLSNAYPENHILRYSVALSLFANGQYRLCKDVLENLMNLTLGGKKDIAANILFLKSLKALGETDRFFTESMAFRAEMDKLGHDNWIILEYNQESRDVANKSLL